jgi:hypothetical protein
LQLVTKEGEMAGSTISPPEVTCAVEVFLATALLHKEQPGRPEFTIQEIVNRAARENITGELRSGVQVHASQHCVANKAPNPAKHRMLFATGKHTRRLLLPGDEVHPERAGKVFPDPGEVPEKYLPLLDWAKARFESAAGDRKRQATTSDGPPETPRRHLENLLSLRLAGAHLANGEDPDDYVRRLREGWE